MNGTDRNEGAEMAAQIMEIVARGGQSQTRLQELLQMVNHQLASYEEALELLSSGDPRIWTYDQAGEVMRIASGRTDRLLSPGEWDLMLPDARAQLHSNYVTKLDDAKRAFTEVKRVVELKIEK